MVIVSISNDVALKSCSLATNTCICVIRCKLSKKIVIEKHGQA